MATAFNTFPQYGFGHYDGQLEDVADTDIVTAVASGSDINFGRAVHFTDYKTVQLPSGSQVSHGITLREAVRDNPAGDTPTPVYPQDHEMSVLRRGRVWVTTVDGASYNDNVYVVPSTGELTNTPSQNAPTGSADGGNTGNGTIGSISATSGTKTGDYVITFIEPATDAGEFQVEDPDGENVGTGTVGSTFTGGGIEFTISDGSTDFVSGDQFTVTVSATNIQLPNAAWKTAANASEIALVQKD